MGGKVATWPDRLLGYLDTKLGGRVKEGGEVGCVMQTVEEGGVEIIHPS
jgi:hypothetical protein